MNHKKPHSKSRRAARTVTAVLALCLLVLPLVACSRPPELDSVRTEFEHLITASEEVNDLLWGEGLAYYDTDSDFAKEHGLYETNLETLGNYRYVTREALASYPSVDDIRAAAEKVYSEAFLSGVSTSLFEGNLITNGGVSVISHARYAEIGQDLCIQVGWDSRFEYHARTYDFSTMKIQKKLSGTDIVTVTIDSTRKDGSDPRTMTLRFVAEDDGWRLDSPTY